MFNEFLDEELFVALDADGDRLKETRKEVHGDVPEKDVAYKEALAQIGKFWGRAKTQIEVKENVDAVALAQLELVTISAADWDSLITHFK